MSHRIPAVLQHPSFVIPPKPIIQLLACDCCGEVSVREIVQAKHRSCGCAGPECPGCQRCWTHCRCRLSSVPAESAPLAFMPANGETIPGLRRFAMRRLEDPTGISGVGLIAYGVLAETGKVVLFWMTARKSIVIYESLDDLFAIVGHGDKTHLEWIDQKPE